MQIITAALNVGDVCCIVLSRDGVLIFEHFTRTIKIILSCSWNLINFLIEGSHNVVTNS